MIGSLPLIHVAILHVSMPYFWAISAWIVADIKHTYTLSFPTSHHISSAVIHIFTPFTSISRLEWRVWNWVQFRCTQVQVAGNSTSLHASCALALFFFSGSSFQPNCIQNKLKKRDIDNILLFLMTVFYGGQWIPLKD